MAEDRTRDAYRLCGEALEREGAERAAYLEEMCRDRPGLRREVDALLAEASAFGPLDVSPWDESAPALDVGEHLGPYEVTGSPSRGGMGVVYRARDTRLGRTVALKVIGASGWSGAGRERFGREARAVASLNHPHICALYDVGSASPPRAGGRQVDYLVMEYLEGQTLEERLYPRADAAGPAPRPLEVGEAVTCAIQIADALTAAHAAGVIHRDLKPSNIMLVEAGAAGTPGLHAKLLDFGLAKRAGAGAPAAGGSGRTSTITMTVPGTVLGTLGYQSPEQARGEEVDRRSDLFALGTLLYEMLTGRRAFLRATPADTMAAVVALDPPRPGAVNPAVPPSCDAVVARALEKDPALRYQSAADLLADLLRLRRELALRSSSSSLDAAAPDRVRSRTRKVAARVAAGMAAIAVITSLAWMLLASARDKPGGSGLPTMGTREVSRGPGLDTEPALAPDAATIAYVSEEGTTSDIWLTDVQGRSMQRWTTNPGVDRHPAWSSDGGRIYFESDRNGAPGIYEASRLNGDQAVMVVPGGREPAVSPDGTRLAFAIGTPARIAVARLHGGTPTHEVVTRSGEGLSEHGSPAWSPDGTEVCYWAWDGLWVVPASGGRARQVTHGSADLHPAWSASNFIYFSSTRGSGWQLWRVASDGTRLGPVTTGLGAERCPALSRDGRTLAFSAGSGGWHVVVRDLASGVERPAGGGGEQMMPAFSRDGRALYMNMLASSRQGIWAQDLSMGVPEGTPRPLIFRFDGTAPRAVSQVSVSADGRFVAFLGISGEERDIFVAPAAGGAASNLTSHPGRDMHPAWSPDGSRLAFSSERDGRMHVWLQAMRDGQAVGNAWRLTARAAEERMPAWSPDGQQVALLTPGPGGGDEVGVVPATGAGATAPLFVTSGARAHYVKWTRHGLLLVSGWQSSGDAVSLRAVDPARKALAASFRAIPLSAGPGVLFDVSPDGKSAALVRGRSDGRIGVLEATAGRF